MGHRPDALNTGSLCQVNTPAVKTRAWALVPLGETC